MATLIEPETERLLLRRWRIEDREPFAALNADARVMEYFPAPLTREQSDALADRCAALIEARGWGLWALERRADSRFIGYVGLNIPGAELPFSPCVEIGWRLSVTAWGRGYATEAARAALGVGFDRLQLPEIVSFTTVGNRRSRAVMERLGMVQSASTFEHPNVPAKSALREHCLYRLSRERWAAGLDR